MSLSKRLLITGGGGFTGRHLTAYFTQVGFDVVCLKSNLLDISSLTLEIAGLQPDYVIHLAAISYANLDTAADYYSVNVVGTVNILDALRKAGKSLKKVILASSAAVYGNQGIEFLHEDLVPNPLSHYGASKLAMELAGSVYRSEFPLLIVRPFNYTGVGHSANFLVPKIVNAYRNKVAELALGNLEVEREFNDIRDIAVIYKDLLENERALGIVNLCSGRLVKLKDLILHMESISGIRLKVYSDSINVRGNDVITVGGDPARLNVLTRPTFNFNISQTLEWMYSFKEV